MARSIAPSRRGGGGGGGGRHSNSLLLPFALTLTTAAIASAGLYFFSDTSNNTSPSRPYLPSDTEEERDQQQPRRSRKPPRTKTAILRREDREADILSGFSDIPEEDTDAIVESRREEEEHRRRKRGSLRGTKAGSMLAYMKGAAVEALEKMNDDGLYDEEEALKIKQIKEEVDKERRQQELARLQRIEQQQQLEQLAREAAQIPLPSDSPPSASGAGAAAFASSSEQYKPIAKRLKHIALVVKERKALHGHDSDSDFEEAMLPNLSLLSHLPRPLNLPNATLHILIYSPHLAPIPKRRSPSPPTPKQNVTESTGLSVVLPEPMPSPSLVPVRSFDDSSKSTSELASDLMSSLSLPEDQIMQFNNPNFVANTLRSISPAVVYFEEELLTRELAEELLRGGAVQTVVLVIGGDEIAGLVSSDEESNERKKGKGKWWEEGGEVRTRLGRRLQVLESWVLDSDWHRRMEDFEEAH